MKTVYCAGVHNANQYLALFACVRRTPKWLIELLFPICSLCNPSIEVMHRMNRSFSLSCCAAWTGIGDVYASSNPPFPTSDSRVPSPRTPSAILPQSRILHADHSGSKKEHAANFFLQTWGLEGRKPNKKAQSLFKQDRKVVIALVFSLYLKFVNTFQKNTRYLNRNWKQ